VEDHGLESVTKCVSVRFVWLENVASSRVSHIPVAAFIFRDRDTMGRLGLCQCLTPTVSLQSVLLFESVAKILVSHVNVLRFASGCSVFDIERRSDGGRRVTDVARDPRR